jgi:hypothetical protein
MFNPEPRSWLKKKVEISKKKRKKARNEAVVYYLKVCHLDCVYFIV